MDNKLIIALVDSLVSDAINKLELREGQRGPRGLKGKDGNDFCLEEHTSQIVDLILQHIPKNFELSEEQIALLKGETGQAGLDGMNGRDGKDGQDFIFEEHVEELTEIIKNASLQFEDLTSEQIENLRGPQGEKGIQGRAGRDGQDFIFVDHEEKITEIIKSRALTFEDFTEEQIEKLRGEKGDTGSEGKSFSLEENKEEINNLIVSYLNEIRDALTLKFEDLTEENRASLKGPRGQRGKPGRDFDLEESLPTIVNAIKGQVEELKPELKLKFSDLTGEEKDSLKLKFEEITPEERLTLRGPRGQRGKLGIQGETGPAGKDGIDGKNGLMGPRGMPGFSGKDGINGTDGVDGENAPKITDVSVTQNKQEFNLVFEFDDGSEIKSDGIKLPKGDTVFYYPAGIGGGGSGPGGAGTNGKSAYQIAVDNGFLGTEADWLLSLQGANGTDGVDGVDGIDGAAGTDGVDGESAYQIALNNGFVGTEADWLLSLQGSGGAGSLTILDEHIQISNQVSNINFIGDGVIVRPRVMLSEWPSMDVVTSMSEWPGVSGNPTKVDVYIDSPSATVINTAGIPRTDLFEITQQMIDEKKVYLSKIPINTLIVIPEGGMQQRTNIDFTVLTSENAMSWDGYGLDGFFEVGEILEVSYQFAPREKFEVVTLTQLMIDSKKVYLSNTPISTVTLIPDGAFSQRNGIDFAYVEGDNSVSWAGLGLEGFLEVGEILEISYLYI